MRRPNEALIQVRRSSERGHFDHGWLNTRHSFSFAEYHDPQYMGFSVLRVINEDQVVAGGGFPTHGHRDMEIVSYVLAGALEHKDSLGNGSVIRPGDVQRMSAGTGVRHSEFNASDRDPVHFLQIWILPRATGLTPSYEQTHFAAAELNGRLRLVASPDGGDGSVTIHQDAFIYATKLERAGRVTHTLAPGRHAYVQVARGSIDLNGTQLSAGDGAAIDHEHDLSLGADTPAEVLLFDLP
jgi:hypothetical protein